MELDLGLTISTTTNTLKPLFDLNSYDHHNNIITNPSSSSSKLLSLNNNKRCFDEAFGENNITTLPLFNKHHQDNSFITTKSMDGDESSVIGWPPIKTWRKRQSYYQVSTGNNNDRTVEMNDHEGWRRSSWNYIKVKMEGVGIARKVDLTLYNSYQTLTNALIPMFGKCIKDVKAYKLTYQDKEGDWLLAGDLPWGTFTQSVQRLKLLKNDC